MAVYEVRDNRKEYVKESDKLKVHQTIKFFTLRLLKNVSRGVFVCDFHYLRLFGNHPLQSVFLDIT